MKRKQLTVPEEYSSLMDKVHKECKQNKISLSRHMCQLAVRDYESRSIGNPKDDARLPAIDKIIHYMENNKRNIADEIIRLHNNKEIDDLNVVHIYLGVLALKIQLDKTELIQFITQLTEEKSLISSKRATLNRAVIVKATGLLIDRMAKYQEEQRIADKRRQEKEIQKQREEAWRQKAEEKRREDDEWMKNNGIDSYDDLEEIPQEELKEN